VRLATYWTTPVDDNGGRHAAFYGLQMMRNYDGAGAHFADVSVGAASSVAGVAIYAAQTSTADGVTVLLINKTGAARSGTLSLPGFAAGAAAQQWSFVAGASAITHGADVSASASGFAVSVPAHAMVMLVVPKA